MRVALNVLDAVEKASNESLPSTGGGGSSKAKKNIMQLRASSGVVCGNLRGGQEGDKHLKI